MVGLALSCGYAAVASLSFFMIPVSRQSPLLAAFGVSPIQALSLHIWAGRICLVCTCIHATIFCLALGLFGMIEGKGFFESIISSLIPSRSCFHYDGITGFEESSLKEESCAEENNTSIHRRLEASASNESAMSVSIACMCNSVY